MEKVAGPHLQERVTGPAFEPSSRLHPPERPAQCVALLLRDLCDQSLAHLDIEVRPLQQGGQGAGHTPSFCKMHGPSMSKSAGFRVTATGIGHTPSIECSNRQCGSCNPRSSSAYIS